jgi:hypothetical protein
MMTHSDRVYRNRMYRPIGVGLGALAVAIGVAVSAASYTSAAGGFVWGVALGVLGVFAWRGYITPHLVLMSSEMHVRNLASSITVPRRCVAGAEVSGRLRIELANGDVISVWALQAPNVPLPCAFTTEVASAFEAVNSWAASTPNTTRASDCEIRRERTPVARYAVFVLCVAIAMATVPLVR